MRNIKNYDEFINESVSSVFNKVFNYIKSKIKFNENPLKNKENYEVPQEENKEKRNLLSNFFKRYKKMGFTAREISIVFDELYNWSTFNEKISKENYDIIKKVMGAKKILPRFLYRGLRINANYANDFLEAFSNKHKIDNFSPNLLTSWSSDIEVAMSFMNKSDSGRPKEDDEKNIGILLRWAPNGDQILADMSNFYENKFYNEMEYILLPGVNNVYVFDIIEGKYTHKINSKKIDEFFLSVFIERPRLLNIQDRITYKKIMLMTVKEFYEEFGNPNQYNPQHANIKIPFYSLYTIINKNNEQKYNFIRLDNMKYINDNKVSFNAIFCPINKNTVSNIRIDIILKIKNISPILFNFEIEEINNIKYNDFRHHPLDIKYKYELSEYVKKDKDYWKSVIYNIFKNIEADYKTIKFNI